MASLAPTLPYTRQPFGCIDGNRLRNLTSAKNRQNGKIATRFLSIFRTTLLQLLLGNLRN